MLSTLNVSIKALQAPSNLSHRSLAEEIALLPDYLQVAIETSGGMSLVSIGEGIPSIDASSLPWFQQNADGSPKGIAVKHSGKWVRAIPEGILSSMANAYMVFGSGTITLNSVANTEQILTGVGAFAPAFDSPPLIFITQTGGTLLAANANGQYYSFALKPIVTVDNLDFSITSAIDNSTSAKTLEISWLAIGQRSQI